MRLHYGKEVCRILLIFSIDLISLSYARSCANDRSRTELLNYIACWRKQVALSLERTRATEAKACHQRREIQRKSQINK